MIKTFITLLIGVFLQQHSMAGPISPSADEVYMLELLNRLRAKPVAESKLMLKSATIPDFVDKNMFIKEFKNIQSSQPLFFDRRMIDAARKHTIYQIKHGQGHYQKEGTVEFTGADIKNRLINSGLRAQLLSSGENTFLYAHNVFHGHVAFTVDWGRSGPGGMQEGRKHRLNLLSSNYNLTGIGILNNGKYKAITQTFATAKGRYAGGVAYDDINKNSIYDPGEGISGIEISYKGKKEFTWESGAYTFPIDKEGGKIVFKWKNHHQAFFIPPGDRNLKFDFILAQSSPEQVTYANIYARDHKNIPLSVSKFFHNIQDELIGSDYELTSAFKFAYYNSQNTPVSIQKEESKKLLKSLTEFINNKVNYLERSILVKPIASISRLKKLQIICSENRTLQHRISAIVKDYESPLFSKILECYEKRQELSQSALKKKLSTLFLPELPLEVRLELKELIQSLD